MCMSVGQPVKGAGVFVAVDTRIQWYDLNYYDAGGKMVDTGSGYAAGGGSYIAVGTALRALRNAGPVPETVDPITRQVETIATALRTSGLEVHHSVPAKDDRSFFTMMLIESGLPDVVTVTNGGLCQSLDGRGFSSALPVAFSVEEKQSRDAKIAADLVEAGEDLAARIKAVAKHFHEVYLTPSSNVSRVMEAGYILPTADGPLRGFLRGSSSEIAESDPREILERFRAEPAPAVFNGWP